MSIHQFVYHFAEAPADAPELLGGKGAGLARMVQSGLPVPPGFIISTDAFRAYHGGGRRVPDQVMAEVWAALQRLEAETGKRFGATGGVPLLVSVRSGAKISMPGMMDTVLNLGLDIAGVAELAAASGNVDFAIDTYLRFWRMYADIVLGLDAAVVDEARPAIDAARAGDFGALQQVVVAAIEREGGSARCRPREQLADAIAAVFNSWDSRRAITYRRHQNIPDDLGTAVVVQSMVFGNLGHPSGSGVAFTRNPLTGENRLYGEYLEGGQGEEVVAGTRTPARLEELRTGNPELVRTLEELGLRLEEVFCDALDIEFTVERGQLYLLQVRAAKRTAQAAIRIASDLMREGRLSPALALSKVSAAQIRQTGQPGFEEKALANARSSGALLGTGIGASPGQASGVAVLDPDRAAETAAQGHSVILVRPTTSPLDLHGMLAAAGILTALGGATSHAAVVARALNKPCIVGFDGLQIDIEQRRFGIAGRWLEEGSPIAMDGASGAVFGVGLPTVRVEASSAALTELLTVADRAAQCDIYGRASTVDQISAVLESGARGIATRLGDILATTGKFEDLIRLLVSQRDAETVEMQGFEQVFAEVLAPLLRASGSASFVVRAVDFIADDAMESLDGAKLIEQNPRLAMPLGIPRLIAAQVAGLALAVERSGYTGVPQLTVRHVTDPNEVQEINRLAEVELKRDGRPKVVVGPTLTTPRGAELAMGIARVSDLIWLEVRGLQAALFGYPLRLFLTREPLDHYVRQRLISVDPRTSLDQSMKQVITQVSAAGKANPRCTIGLRLAGPVSEEIAKVLVGGGFRTFAVDTHEVRPARLALGKAALALDGGRPVARPVGSELS